MAKRDVRWSVQTNLVTCRSGNKKIMALCFVVNRHHKLFIKCVSKNDLIYAITNARGEYGTCLDYYQKTLNSLNKLGLEDNFIHRLVTAAVAKSTV